MLIKKHLCIKELKKWLRAFNEVLTRERRRHNKNISTLASHPIRLSKSNSVRSIAILHRSKDWVIGALAGSG
eukprot:1158301-Pelagomonas_calceolata.AAC.9